MYFYGCEIFFIVTVILTGIAALQSGPLKTRKAEPPDAFFEPPSLVTDFYNGNIKNLMSLLSEKDISLVMYYAPWDASSLHAREEIEAVARFYHNEVFFAAINCWWPEGTCRKKYNVPAYPLLLVYVYETGIIQYKGPLLSSYVISFLDSILNPVVPLHKDGEILDLLMKHEGVFVAYFDFKDQNHIASYGMFYKMALQSLSNDPYRKLCFAVVTNKYDAYNLKLKSAFQLYLWNSTEIYTDIPKSDDYLHLVKWAYSHLKQVTDWISPPGVKSTILSEAIEENPTLILFSPRNLLLEYSPYYSLLKEVALDYNNCKESSFVQSLIHRMVLKRHIIQEQFSRSIHKCHSQESRQSFDVCRQRPHLCDFTCCQTTQLDLKHNRTCACRACLHHVISHLEDMKLSECENTLGLILAGLNIKQLGIFRRCNDVEATFPVKFGQYKRLTVHCQLDPTVDFGKPHPLTNSQLEELKDDHIVTMIQNSEKQLCHRLRYALNYSELNFPSSPVPSDSALWLVDFTGLRCRTNRTLNFIAMDSVLYYSFAESLGINITSFNHQTSAAIVEIEQENQFVLEGQVTKKSLVEFIKNYTVGNLQRHLRMPVRKLGNFTHDPNSNVCVEEINTASFFNVIMDEKDVVLLYYAPWCGPCKSIFHIYLSVVYYFSNIDGIRFARINGEENDLPWEYTVEKYPTIIFFPANDKSESEEFPAHLPITITNLLHFVLVHSQRKVRRAVAWEMCNQECVAHNLVMSSRELRRLFRDHKSLVNNLHFTQLLINRSRKALKDQPKGRKQPTLNYLRSVYLKNVVQRVHKKRWQIAQALQLQKMLREKRDFYLASRKKEKSKVWDGRNKVKRDEL